MAARHSTGHRIRCAAQSNAPFVCLNQCRAAGAHWLITMDEPRETVTVQALTDSGRAALARAGVSTNHAARIRSGGDCSRAQSRAAARRHLGNIRAHRGAAAAPRVAKQLVRARNPQAVQ